MSKQIRVKEADIPRIEDLHEGDESVSWPDKINIILNKAEKYDSMVNRVVDPEDTDD